MAKPVVKELTEHERRLEDLKAACELLDMALGSPVTPPETRSLAVTTFRDAWALYRRVAA